ncbi:MAG: YaiO family outer membrane beta-barrel protein, partial [bacterium]|nr:YaiO family outer membrane beta-barrel protein [bacterium]
MNYKTTAIPFLLLIAILLTATQAFTQQGTEETDEKTPAMKLLTRAKTLRVVKKYPDALDTLREAFPLAGDNGERASIQMETAYVKYLVGNSYNVFKRNIQQAYDFNPGVEVDERYEDRFKRVVWEVREAKTGVAPPPRPRETVIPQGRMGPGLVGPEPLEEPQQKMKKNRLDLQYIYEYLSPHDEHGAWESYYIKYYRYQTPTFNFFIHGGMVKRRNRLQLEGNDYIVLLGFAKDWSPRLYTYTVVAKGSIADYLPNARVDHDFNWKVGLKMNPLLTFGVTYIKYYVPAEDFIVSGGFTWYMGKWVWGYRLFWNHKFPGDITSFSHLCSAAYGREKKSWSTLSASWGSQAYLALYV